MASWTKLRAATSSALVAGALVLTACSSTGGTGVSQSQVEAKLRKEPQITVLKGRAGSHYDAVVACLAKTLKKVANGSDLDDYVNGDKTLKEIGGDGSKASTDAAACVKRLIGSK